MLPQNQDGSSLYRFRIMRMITVKGSNITMETSLSCIDVAHAWTEKKISHRKMSTAWYFEPQPQQRQMQDTIKLGSQFLLASHEKKNQNCFNFND